MNWADMVEEEEREQEAAAAAARASTSTRKPSQRILGIVGQVLDGSLDQSDTLKNILSGTTSTAVFATRATTTTRTPATSSTHRESTTRANVWAVRKAEAVAKRAAVVPQDAVGVVAPGRGRVARKAVSTTTAAPEEGWQTFRRAKVVRR